MEARQGLSSCDLTNSFQAWIYIFVPLCSDSCRTLPGAALDRQRWLNPDSLGQKLCVPSMSEQARPCHSL